MTITIIEDIRNKIASAKLDQALKIFIANCNEYANELIIQSNRYYELKSLTRQNLISREESNIERNQICAGLLELLNEVDIKETNSKNEDFNISSELKDILGFAELISRRKGKERTSTKDFFAALNTVRPDSLLELIEELDSKKALPKPVDKELLDIPRKLSNNRVLSPCITESLKELQQVSEKSNRISVDDMFIDVSKNGKGKSVAKLRKKGIGVNEIEGYVEKFKLSVKERPHGENTYSN